MSDQLTFDEALARRDAGIAAADEHADPDWKRLALDTLHAYLLAHPTMFVDDIWTDTDLPRPRESRALGPVILTAKRNGWMARTNVYRPSVASNLSPKPVWRSMIYEGPR